MTTLTEYVVHSGATGSRPMWWEVCPATTREHAFDVMHHLAELTPEAFGPYGHRRLRIVATNSGDMDPTPVDDLESWHDSYDPVRSAEFDALLDEAFGTPKCGVRGCVLPPHDAHWRMHEDAEGRGWYPGEAPR